MAEAVVVIEDQPQIPPRYFCHSCNVEMESVSPEYTCLLCSGGFIEELPASDRTSTSSGGDTEMLDGRNYMDLNSRLNEEISSILMSVAGGAAADEFMQSIPNVLQHSLVDGGGGASVTLGRGGNSGGANVIVGGGPRRGANLLNNLDFDNVVQDFLISIVGGAGGAAGPPMYFMGNPADYVYTRDGLDTIVTQLLNQLDGTGPPPLAKDKIAEIPSVGVTEEQVQSKLQCSVCWEVFQISETVRKLPCLHIYHENCIVPWLEIHGTCPVCRKTINENPDDQLPTSVAAGVGNSLAYALSRPDRVENSYNNSSSSSTGHNRASTSEIWGNFGRSNSQQSQQQQQQQQPQQQQPQPQQRSSSNDQLRDDIFDFDFD